MEYKPLFTFKKENGKWKALINAKTTFYFQQTLGIPKEIFVDWINNLSKKELLLVQITDWRIFTEENNINTEDYKYDNEANKEKILHLLKEKI